MTETNIAPDNGYRRRMWFWLGFTIISGASLLYGLYLWVQRLAAGLGTTTTLDQYDQQIARVMLALGFGVVLTACGLAALLLKWTRDTRTQQVWPPKDLQMAADTEPKYGLAAEIMAKRMERSAWFLGAIALAVLIWAGVRLGPAAF